MDENEGNVGQVDSVALEIPPGSALKAKYDQVAPAAVPAKGQGGTSVEKTTTTADSPPNEEEVVSERRS